MQDPFLPEDIETVVVESTVVNGNMNGLDTMAESCQIDALLQSG